ncbi:MAG: hypothetical protein ACP5UH_02585 [Candidatus Micrarchaeia archaeon]
MAENEEAGEAKTTIDTLVDLLRERGKVDLNSLSLSLGVDPKVVEDWAKVLDSAGVVKISYEMGRMFVELLQLGTEELSAAEKKLENEKGTVEEELSSQSITLDRFFEAIKNVNVNIGSLEKSYREALPDVEGLLSQIGRFEEVANTSTKRIDDAVKKAEDTYNAINKRFEELSKRLDMMSYTNFDRAIEEGNAKVAATLKEAGAAREALRAIEASNAEAFKAMLKSIDAQAAELKRQALQKNNDIIKQLRESSAELEALAKSMQDRSNEVKSVNSDLADFKMHRAGAIRTLNMEKSEFNDIYAKMHSLMVDSKGRIGSTAKELTEKVSALKSSFGDAAMLYDKLQELKGDVDVITKQIESAKAEISNLSSQLKALDTLHLSLAEKAAKVKSVAASSKKSRGKVHSIKKDIDKLSKKI